MIGFFPQIYDDELVYSWFSRYMVYSGYTSVSDVYLDIYDSKIVRPSVELINNLSPDTKHVISKYTTTERLIYDHTMFPEYGRFIDEDQRERLIKSGDFTIGNWNNTLMVPISSKKRILRYCPLCSSEDREKLGETYWHRRHQINNIRICTKHRVYLSESTVVIDHSLTRLKPAEAIIPYENTVVRCVDDMQVRLSIYMEEVFINPGYSYCQIGRFLSKKIGDSYRHENGNRRLYEFYDDYNAFYSALDSDDLMSIDYMSKLLRGSKSAFCYICQLAVFEGITVEELLEHHDETDGDLIFRRVSEVTGEPIDLCEKIGKAVIREYKNQSGNLLKNIRYQQRCMEEDEKLLQRVKDVCAEIYDNGNERPRRVTVTLVGKMVGVDYHKLKKLGRCMNIIMDYYEVQQEFWARELIWAVKEIRRREEPLNFKHIRLLINLRRENIVDSLMELKKLDEDTYTTVSDLIS